MANVRITGSANTPDEGITEGASVTSSQVAIFFDDAFPQGKNAVYLALLRLRERMAAIQATRED